MMALPLPRLRSDLEIGPSPIADRPGLLLRDPYRYSDSALVVPPLLARCLACFDGRHTDAELRDRLVHLTGGPGGAALAEGLVRALAEARFLEDESFAALKRQRHHTFAAATIRQAVHAGGGYPEQPDALARTLDGWLGAGGSVAGAGPRSPAGAVAPAAQDRTGDEELVAIAAPHVSPAGGDSAYGAAYRALGAAHAGRTFVILGTSHYGQPDRLGLTRKGFRTPLGEAVTDTGLVDEMARAAGDAAVVEDYCHAVEHSIEFQVLFLQRLFGPAVRIVPVLCGPFFGGADGGGAPEQVASAARALDALGALQARHGARLLWVLGVDLAHVGRRYGDAIAARADEGPLRVVAGRDRARLDRVAAGDAAGFWRLSHERGTDDLKWCGSAPLYAFLRAVPEARGQLSEYVQWNIDDESVVSFAAMRFSLRR